MDDYLNQIDCPQYVDFMAENKYLGASPLGSSVKDLSSLAASPSGSSVKELSGLESSPSGSSVKNDIHSENMDKADGNSYYSQDSKLYPEILTDSCLGYSSYQESMKSVSPVSCQMDDFPIHRPKNISPKKIAPKNFSRGNKTAGVQTFHFMESLKRKREDEHIPLAEQVIAFHKKTPQRFHTTNSKTFEPMEHWSPPVLNPKSPNLRAAKRIRGVSKDVLSREEKEQKEAEEMKGYRFRARPLHRSILQPAQPAKGKRKTPTKPQSLHLKTAQRAAEIQARKKVDEKPYEFHARPVPKAILNGPTGIKEKPSLPVTEAKTPNFALKRRAEKWKNEDKLNATYNSSENQSFKALPAPVSNAPFVPKHEKKHTEIQPFSFDSKDKERIAKKEEKIMKEIEKENAVFLFKAQGMPSPTPRSLPTVGKKPATIPQPFSFYSDGKNSKPSSFNSSLDQTHAVFKAQPATVLEKPPFIPQKSSKQPVEVEEFHLHTDIRAIERQKLKEINDIKEREKELALQELKRLQEEEERREIEKLRKEIVHKANPIRHFKPVEIKPSNKGLTMPISPKFKTDERLQMKR